MRRRTACWALITWVAAAAPLVANASVPDAPVPAAPVAVTAGSAGLSWQPRLPYRAATLVVAGRDGIVSRQRFGPGEALLFAPFDAEGQPLPDGIYRWELLLVKELPPAIAEALRGAEEAGDAAAYGELVRAIGGTTLRIAGRFRVEGGSVPSPAVNRLGESSRSAPVPDASDSFASESAPLAGDTVISDPTPRLTFEDTDANENDFYIEAETDVLGVWDLDAAVQVIGVEAGSSADSIYVAPGMVGLFTSVPAVDFHIKSEDSLPEIRLEENVGDAQVWDLRSSIGDFQIVDQSATPASKTPLEIDASQSPINRSYELIFRGSATIEGDVSLGSSREIKRDLAPAEGDELLARLEELPLFTWSYEDDPEGARHLGPVAEDFHALFGLGRDARHISPADTAGLALAAVQELSERLRRKDAEIEALRARLEALEALPPAADLCESPADESPPR